MKILKYKLATETNHGTPEKPMMETVLSDALRHGGRLPAGLV